MKELIEKCKDFDRYGQREMVKHLSPYLFKICYRYMEDYSNAQDALQESLVIILNKINQFQGQNKNSFLAWCKRICIHKSLEITRKYESKLDLLSDDHPITQAPQIIAQLNAEDIFKLVKKLARFEKKVFLLYVVDGFSHKEIAELLEIKESSSRTYLHRARNQMKKFISQSEIFPL